MTGQRSVRVGIAAVTVACGLLSACSKEPVLTPVLPDVRYVTVDARPLGPAQYRGHPVLINFWSSTCGICMREMPLLQDVHTEMAPRGLVVIALAMPYDRPSDALELKSQKRWGFDVAVDPQGSVVKAFGDIQAIPTTVLFDANGKRVWQHTGELQAAELRAQLERVLKPQG